MDRAAPSWTLLDLIRHVTAAAKQTQRDLEAAVDECFQEGDQPKK